MKRFWKVGAGFAGALALMALFADVSFAQEADLAEQVAGLQAVTTTIWLIISAALVFFMQAGFALLEAGSVQSKNVANVLMKNLADFAIATFAFLAVGYAFMFGDGTPFIGLSGFFLNEFGGDPVDLTFWFFQLVFAGTAATIVSGAVAERTKFGAYLIFSLIITAFIYPIYGHWVWGGGWLSDLSFLGDDVAFTDFAGSTVVHSVGGWAAFFGAMVVGARIGRFDKDGKPVAIPGHSVTMVALGVFILWIGWFGFNAGSQLSASTGDDATAIALIAANTTIAAAMGAIGAVLYSLKSGKVSFTAGFAGVLGGLVAITAPCAFVTPLQAVIIGLVGGAIVPWGMEMLEKFKIDDPAGAVPVHLMAGVWGTLAVGLFPFNMTQLMAQVIGILACAVWAGGLSYLTFLAIDKTIGMRVSAEEELHGLDYDEHGIVAYPDINAIPGAAVPATAEIGTGVSRAPAK
ncbi:MAG: ammonium transporter [Chloroflexaceae bacterium]|nr:ammonium transporter [Chloroflexaceae bacterium]